MLSQGCGVRRLPSASPPTTSAPIPSRLCFLLFDKLLGALPGSSESSGPWPWLPCPFFEDIQGRNLKLHRHAFQLWVCQLPSHGLVDEVMPLSESRFPTYTWIVTGLLTWFRAKVPRKHSVWCLLSRSFLADCRYCDLSSF